MRCWFVLASFHYENCLVPHSIIGGSTHASKMLSLKPVFLPHSKQLLERMSSNTEAHSDQCSTVCDMVMFVFMEYDGHSPVLINYSSKTVLCMYMNFLQHALVHCCAENMHFFFISLKKCFVILFMYIPNKLCHKQGWGCQNIVN